MIKIPETEGDDERFLGFVEAAISRIAGSFSPAELYVIKIDHWFDFKWRDFEGKTLGALGCWNTQQLRIPPFIPDRVVEQNYFENVNGNFESRDVPDLHVYQTSAQNLTGDRRLTPNRTARLFIWFSGDTRATGRGSLMIYQVGEESHRTSYISFVKKAVWQIYHTDGISRNEARHLVDPDLVIS